MNTNAEIPRKEYPRPQFFRPAWQTLNGQWSCVFDQTDSGRDNKFFEARGFEKIINVPFAPESKLSGIGYTDFINGIWYHRKITIPADWQGKEVMLHFGGVNYNCIVYMDGREIARHTGGSSPFSVNITGFADNAEHNLVVYARNDVRGGLQASGKQSPWVKSRACNYTRTTGIWQSVWMEAVDKYALSYCRIVPDFDNNSFGFFPEFYNLQSNMTLTVTVLANKQTVAAKTVKAANGIAVTVEVPAPRPWSPEDPFLYDIIYEVQDCSGKLLDRVESYAGLRKIHLENGRFYLNNQPIFLRLVLDQGFYEDGIWTAPDDEAIKKDILLVQAAGFNGARLHQKVFDERFHYHADKLGYLTWGEFPDWGISFWEVFRKCNPDYMRALRNYYAEWATVVKRDLNHPSIICWVPFNETRDMYDWAEHCRFIADIYNLTRQLDPTRPVNDTSGYTHIKTDIWSLHCYHQDGASLAAVLTEKPVNCFFPDKELAAWNGQPILIDEYGGISYLPPERKPYADNTWGYNKETLSQEETQNKIIELTRVLVNAENCAGYCYTQFTDIEQEQNGIYNYDRTEKFDMQVIKKCFSDKPGWSKY